MRSCKLQPAQHLTMVVPAMEAQGTSTMGSLIKRRVEARTTWLTFYPPQTTTTTTTSEPPAGFAVHLTCQVTMCISTGGRRVTDGKYLGRAGAEAICFVVPGSGEDGVRDALRGALRSIRALQDLRLTDDEWESIVPEDVVPKLADPEEWRGHGAAEVSLAVDRYIRYNAARMLMTGCKKIDDNGDGGVDCCVCLDALLRGGEAVELPGCAHAFHRRCISKWFRRKPTCPLCRGDVVKHLDPELQKHIAEFSGAMD